ncbi:hypothetical protein NPIL_309911 [Nephila pilipes]|uniref:Uncharacterized protein n=1 Tax=Nephila pilipes TaxID=299642 RepID=A0A8X6UJR5_NEPPI|nr:hypothetical protein NPIL_309911 [Nephila pilipes]
MASAQRITFTLPWGVGLVRGHVRIYIYIRSIDWDRNESLKRFTVDRLKMKVLLSLFLIFTLLSCTMAIISVHLGHSHHYVPSYGHGYSHGHHGYGHHHYPSYGHGHGHSGYGHHHPALTIGFGRR